MELSLQQTPPRRIVTSPPGRGWRARPEIAVNNDYVRKLLEESRLTERDETLLKYLDELTVLSAQQIKRLLWTNSTHSNMHRRLRALYDYHLVDRVRMLDKQHGITYTLGKAGRLWLHGTERIRGGGAPQVNVQLLAHDLTIAEVIVRLIEDLRWRDPSGEKLRLEWMGEEKARFVYKEKVIVEPDGRLRVWTQSKHQTFLLEVDMGSERAAAFQAKIQRYHHAYAQPGLRDEYNVLSIIMVITPSGKRAEQLAEIIVGYQKQAKEIDLVWVLAALPDLAEGLYGNQQWTVVKHGQVETRRLAEL